MGTQEIILILAIPVILFLIFNSLETLKMLHQKGQLTAGDRLLFTYITIIIPILGFVISKFLARKARKVFF